MALPRHFNWHIIVYALRDAWPTWLLLAGFGGAALLGYAFSRNASDAFRYAGTALQAFGLFLVAYGLHSMRRLFGRPSIVATIRSWFDRLAAAFRGPNIISGVGISAGHSQVSGRGRVTMTPGPGSDLERRVSLLEQAVTDFRTEYDAETKELRGSIAATNQNLDNESRERRDQHRKTTSLLEEVAVGGLHLETIGVVWLVLGVIAASIPNELADWLAAAQRLAR